MLRINSMDHFMRTPLMEACDFGLVFDLEKGGAGEDYGMTFYGHENYLIFLMFLLGPGFGSAISIHPEVDRDKWVQLVRVLTWSWQFYIESFHQITPTLRKFNMEPEKWWFPIGISFSKGPPFSDSIFFFGMCTFGRLHDAGAQLGFGEDMSNRMKKTTNLGPKKGGRHFKTSKTADDIKVTCRPVEASDLFFSGSCFRTQLLLDWKFLAWIIPTKFRKTWSKCWMTDTHWDNGEIWIQWLKTSQDLQDLPRVLGPKVRETKSGKLQRDSAIHVCKDSNVQGGNIF